MNPHFYQHLSGILAEIESQGLSKRERIISSRQAPDITLQNGRHFLNFCANNYLGLADDAELIEVAAEAIKTHGYGMASVRLSVARKIFINN